MFSQTLRRKKQLFDFNAHLRNQRITLEINEINPEFQLTTKFRITKFTKYHVVTHLFIVLSKFSYIAESWKD